MTSIKMLSTVGGRKEGEVVDVTPGAAAFLTNAGYAEAASKTDQPKRGRRTTTRTDAEASESESEVDSE